jgi:hypothetical protein
MMARRIGAIVALLVEVAFLLAAVQVRATAAPPSLNCTQQPCPYTIAGHGFDLSFGGNKLKCQALDGRGRFTTHTAGTMKLAFRDCHEQMTPFGFSCRPSGPSTKVLTTGSMLAQILEEPGLRMIQGLPLKMAFTCGVLRPFLIEGFIFARIEDENCGVNAASYRMPVEVIAHGHQGEERFIDVYPHGTSAGSWEFEDPWQIRFSSVARFLC